MASTARSIPNDEDLVELVRASLSNARDQLEAAEVLIDHTRWPVAYSLATLAFEEVGKACLCLTALAMPDDLRQELSFWKQFNSHSAKLGMAYTALVDQMGDDAPPESIWSLVLQWRDRATLRNAAKFRGLYVDFQGGAVLRRWILRSLTPGEWLLISDSPWVAWRRSLMKSFSQKFWQCLRGTVQALSLT